MKQGKRDAFTQEQLERVARMYRTVEDAARALQIDKRSFSRLCRKHGIEGPYKRRQREMQEARAGSV